VLEFFPLIGWFAGGTTLAMLAMLAAAGDLRGRSAAVLIALFLMAAYAQFFSGSVIARAVGLTLQTLLAISLIVRWRLSV
jgi:hypothetical protein